MFNFLLSHLSIIDLYFLKIYLWWTVWFKKINEGQLAYSFSHDPLLKVCIKYEPVVGSVVIEMLIVVVTRNVSWNFRLVIHSTVSRLSLRNFPVSVMVFLRGPVVRNVPVLLVGGGENVRLTRMWKHVLSGPVVYLVEVMPVVSVMVIGWFGAALFTVAMVTIALKQTLVGSS